MPRRRFYWETRSLLNASPYPYADICHTHALSVAARWNYRRHSAFSGSFDNRVAVAAFIGDKTIRVYTSNKSASLCTISDRYQMLQVLWPAYTAPPTARCIFELSPFCHRHTLAAACSAACVRMGSNQAHLWQPLICFFRLLCTAGGRNACWRCSSCRIQEAGPAATLLSLISRIM